MHITGMQSRQLVRVGIGTFYGAFIGCSAWAVELALNSRVLNGIGVSFSEKL
jgi:hypothetical protein